MSCSAVAMKDTMKMPVTSTAIDTWMTSQ